MINKGQFKICLIFTFLFVAVICVNPSFALLIDQNTDTGSLQVHAYYPVGQSFTATDTDIGYVGLWVEPYNQTENDLTLTMSLFSGAGDFDSSALLTNSSFTLSTGYDNWLDLDVSAVSFTQNALYTIGISNDTSQWGVSINWHGNPYSGGRAYYRDSVGSDGDLKFHVGPVAPVPEPATMLLLGAGLIGLAGFRRKFKKA